ncbi:MAG: S41 family peptidase [Ferruginibacter sp.]
MSNRVFASLSLFLLLAGATDAQTRKFSAAALQSDIQYLHEKLEANHPGLYLYNSKATIDRVFDSLRNNIRDSMTGSAFYYHISCISSVIKDGHTILLPDPASTDYHNKHSRFLPYYFAVIDGRLYVNKVCTPDTRIPAGAEITSINGLDAASLLNQLMERQIRDGNNLSYPAWILQNYFREYYSFHFGHAERYEIGYKLNGETDSATIDGLVKDSIYHYRQLYFPNISFGKRAGEGLTLDLSKSGLYALLGVRDFHNEALKDAYKQNFDKTIRHYFSLINERHIKNLVLDLRGNQGGDIENGVTLLSYLLNEPFAVLQGYARVGRKGELKNCGGPALGMHKPKPGRFTGKLYVLVDGGSFSNSGIVASCLKAHKRAVFIGEETGGNPVVINGDSKDFQLPNSRLYIEIPTKQYIIADKASNTGRGVFPDHSVRKTILDLVRNNDKALSYAIGLLD